MLKRAEMTDPNSCMSRAHDDEPTFVLLGRDPAAPAAIRAWITERLMLGKNKIGDEQLAEAEGAVRVFEAHARYADRRRPPAEPSGADLIARERERQKKKGYDAAHDDGHEDGSLLTAAMLLLVQEQGHSLANVDPPDMHGPWPDQLFLWTMNKHKGNIIGRLTVAGAMIAAELDRLIRERARQDEADSLTRRQVPE